MLLLKIFRKALPPEMQGRTQEMLKVPAIIDPKYASPQVFATHFGTAKVKKQLREQVSRVTASTIASLRKLPAAGVRDLMRLGHSTHEPDVGITLADRQPERRPNTSKLYFHGTTVDPTTFLRPDPKHFATGVHGTGLYLSPDYFTALEYMGSKGITHRDGHVRKYTVPSSLKLCDAETRNPLSSVSSSSTKQHIDGLKKLFVNLATFYGIDPKKKFNFSRNKIRDFSIASRHIDMDDLENHLGSLLHAFQTEDRENNEEQFTLNDVFDSKKFNPHKSMYAYSQPQAISLIRLLRDLHVTMALNMMNDPSNAHHDTFIRDQHGNLETKDQLTRKKTQMMKIIQSLPHEEMASHMLAAMGYDGLKVTPASEKSNIVIFPHAVHKLRFEGSARSVKDELDARHRR